ncbi:MAG: hypothetical protein ACC645_01720 [Pirellulales bacterium]
MKSMLAVVLSIAVTILCWGVYGPVLHWGQHAMDHSRLRPFICVGLAYFLIGVVVPAILLQMRKERGKWTAGGVIWSLLAGAVGAIGALGIIMAFAFGGRPVFVMPLVFGGAPVVNSFLTVYWSKAFKKVGPMFLAGLIMVLAGSVAVLIFRPGSGAAAAAPSLSVQDLMGVFVSLAVVILSWGVYGPMLHKGQMKMDGSRLRPLMCVGIAYFGIAVIVPGILLGIWDDPGRFSFMGTVWSLAAGAAGAIGALGIILAFTYGGKPVYVMPLVFGGAPVVNTFVSVIEHGNVDRLGPFFGAGLILVVVGAVIVLVFAPRGDTPPRPKRRRKKPKAEPAPQTAAPTTNAPENEAAHEAEAGGDAASEPS